MTMSRISRHQSARARHVCSSQGGYVYGTISGARSDAEIAAFVRAIGQIAREHGLVESGYRLLANVGGHGGQEVPHLHVHLFGGAVLGPMLAH